mmetsp:Transcript_30404/g.48582  ORF Transcript_30404/g.48582 Transcript_30404/m.48582 type:complete len:122 (+) Transcript_30404:2831-3196(+)
MLWRLLLTILLLLLLRARFILVPPYTHNKQPIPIPFTPPSMKHFQWFPFAFHNFCFSQFAFHNFCFNSFLRSSFLHHPIHRTNNQYQYNTIHAAFNETFSMVSLCFSQFLLLTICFSQFLL